MKNKIIVIEGLDGSGKSTQTKLLLDRLKNEDKLNVNFIHFPIMNDNKEASNDIARFLRGEYNDISVDSLARLFATNRLDNIHLIEEYLDNGILLMDRYVNSNIAYQCARLENQIDIENLTNMIIQEEYVINMLPKPDLNIYLDVSLEFITKNLKDNNLRDSSDREYLNGKKDVNESSILYQTKVMSMYKKMIENSMLKSIKCYDEDNNNKMLDIKTINDILYNEIKYIL